MLPLFKLGLGGRFGRGRTWMSWIALADEVGAIRFLLEHDDASGAFNLAGPEPVTNAEFTKILGKVLRRPTLVPVPPFGPKLLLGARAGRRAALHEHEGDAGRAAGDGLPVRAPDLETGLRTTLAV